MPENSTHKCTNAVNNVQPIRNSSHMANILSVYNRLQAGDYENGNGGKRRVSRLTQFIHATLQLWYDTADVHLSPQVWRHGTGFRAPFTTLRPWAISRRCSRHYSSLLTFNSNLTLMLLHALYERLCTAPLNRLPCYGALEVIVTLLLLLLPLSS